MNICYGTNNYNEVFKQTVNFIKEYNKIIVFLKRLPHHIKSYRSHRTFKSIYRIYVIDTRYQNDHIGPQPIQLNFKFSAAAAVVVGHALVLTRKVISDNSDGKKVVDIVS